MNIAFGVAIFCLIGWMLLAFVLAIPSGFVHLPLAAGVILIVKGIVDGKRNA